MKISVAIPLRKIFNLIPQTLSQFLILFDTWVFLFTKELNISTYKEFFVAVDKLRGILLHQLMKSADKPAYFGCTFFKFRLVPINEVHENYQDLLPISFCFKNSFSAFCKYRFGYRKTVPFQISHNRCRLSCCIRKSRSNNLKQILRPSIDNICSGAAFS